MSRSEKPIPKSQARIYKETVEGGTIPSLQKNRGSERSMKGDETKEFKIGLKDIDKTIFYYFNNVIKPSVQQNNQRVDVPVIYGSPEKWKSVQKDGSYRDKNGKIQTPLIMVKRDSIEKNRKLGNKMDANNPKNYGVFEQKFTKENRYSKFSTLNNRKPVKEYHGVLIPDYINIEYRCIIFTEYVEQMNKLIEAINFASDSYWGNPEEFSFRAMIDRYTTPVELRDNADRVVRTEFTIKLLGHIIPDGINTIKPDIRKFFSKARVTFDYETTTQDLNKPGTEVEPSQPVTEVGKVVYFGWSSKELYDIDLLSELTKLIQPGKEDTYKNVDPTFGEYVYYIYPSKYGDLVSIELDNSTEVLGAFTKISSNYLIDSVEHNVYKSNADNAFTGDTLTFKIN